MSPTAIDLILTVLFEAFGTACIQASQQFTRPKPSLGAIPGQGAAFWFLSQALRTLPLGVVHARWSGLGIVLACAAGWFVFGRRPDLAAVVGMVLIGAGIVVMQPFPGTVHG
jgi:small multidrug resistance pump